MVKNVNLNPVARLTTLERQAEIKTYSNSNPFDINIFDKVDISNEAKSASQVPLISSQGQSENNQRSKIFAGVFLANVNSHGIKGAYDLAWAAVRSEFSFDNDFPVYSPENQHDRLVDISAYY